MGHDKENKEPVKNKKSPKEEQIKQNSYDTPSETYHDPLVIKNSWTSTPCPKLLITAALSVPLYSGITAFEGDPKKFNIKK